MCIRLSNLCLLFHSVKFTGSFCLLIFCLVDKANAVYEYIQVDVDLIIQSGICILIFPRLHYFSVAAIRSGYRFLCFLYWLHLENFNVKCLCSLM